MTRDRNDGPSDPSPTRAAAPKSLPAKTARRPEIRAALALEEAGRLQEAARVFELAGEHDEAASLRLEHASTLRDRQLRLDVLREGCARISGRTPQGRALHLALGELLLEQASAAADEGSRRSLRIEAAESLDRAGESARAGELFESYGLLSQAAGAYERAGAIQRLEFVLAVIERREQAAAAAAEFEAAVELAVREGRRREARLLVKERFGALDRSKASARPSMVALESRLEHGRTRPGRVDLRDHLGSIVHVRAHDELVIGRSPDADVTVALPAVSRRHVALRLAPGPAGRPRLVAIDQGSHAGTFWDDEGLAAGQAHPLLGRGLLGLAFAANLHVVPIAENDVVSGALVQSAGGSPEWTLFSPRGGSLWLSPERLAPARLEFHEDHACLVVARNTSTWLENEPLGPGARVELLVGDRLRLVRESDPPIILEVIA